MARSTATRREYIRILQRIEKRIEAGGARAGECETHCTSTRLAERAAIKSLYEKAGRLHELPQYLIDPVIPNRKQRFSKKKSLQTLPRNWVELVIAQAKRSKYFQAILIALVSGCRPCELGKGATIIETADGIEIDIIGAKVHDGPDYQSGQDNRWLKIKRSPVTDMIERGQYHLPGTVASYRTTAANIGLVVTPEARNRFTAYTMRHAFAAALKSAGVDPDDVSLALGHRSSKARRRYGHGHGGKGIGPTELTAVTATHPVRDVGGHPGAKRRRLKHR